MKHVPAKLLLLTMLPAVAAATQASWEDITDETGLGQHAVARVKFADLNTDGHPDIIIIPENREATRPTVFLHSGTGQPGDPPQYAEKAEHGLPPLQTGDVAVFADIDNDGIPDAVIGRYLDIYQDTYVPPAQAPTRTAWLPGLGDGSFGEAIGIPAARLATTRAIAVGDVNVDGRPDLWIGNWYERYFTGYEGFANDLLLQYGEPGDHPAFVRWPVPGETVPGTYADDLGGRPTYGVALPRFDDGLPMLLELNYGRRWNRLYRITFRQPIHPPGKDLDHPPLVLRDERARGDHLVRQLKGIDIAPEARVDGDAIRHGRHPRWPESHASDSPRSRRSDEAPFRSNGNTFDAAIGDIDNDGDFDLFVTTIIHAWAGESSDRSRFLVNQLEETGELRFLSFEGLSVDRIPELPPAGAPLDSVHTRYNQGDIQAELADLNNDGRLDLLLCSSDYPDPPPHDERLRVYFQQADGRFLDVTHDLGIDHVGAGMPSLADIDDDGDLDLVIGQSFHRLPADQRRAAALVSGALPPDAPADAKTQTRLRLFQNHASGGRQSIRLDLVGDPAKGTSRDAYGTIVRLTADLDGDPETPDVTQLRQVLGPAGHAGKQHSLTVHFGLGEADAASLVEILWPGPDAEPARLEALPAGHYTIRQSE